MLLQDIFPYCVPTTPTDTALPPPKQAAEELKRVFLSLLLKWETEMREGESIGGSRQAGGHLTSLLRYLRTPLERDGRCGGGGVRLREAAHLLESLERERREIAERRQRSSQTTEAVIRRRILAVQQTFQGMYRFQFAKLKMF